TTCQFGNGIVAVWFEGAGLGRGVTIESVLGGGAGVNISGEVTVTKKRQQCTRRQEVRPIDALRVRLARISAVRRQVEHGLRTDSLDERPERAGIGDVAPFQLAYRNVTQSPIVGVSVKDAPDIISNR